MRIVRMTRRGAAAALAVAAVALTAGCSATASAAPRSAAPRSAAPRSAGARPAVARPAGATVAMGAGNAGAFPSVFVASYAPARPGGPGERLALLSSRTGRLVRWLAPQPEKAADGVLSVRDGWVYVARYPDSGSPAIWRLPVTGGRAQLVQAGASDYAVSPDGRAVAYVTSADHGNVVELVARNLVTGQHNTIIVATKPSPQANNWPPGVSGLSWDNDDAHVAVQVQPTTALSSVLVFDAFTATTINDGRTASAPCAAVAGSYQCDEWDPAYLASGALSYIIQRASPSGTTSDSLVTYQAGHRTTLLAFPAGMQTQLYDMTAQGQAIWVSGPARPKGPWTIWRWSGGAPVKVITLPPLGASPYYGVGTIGW